MEKILCLYENSFFNISKWNGDCYLYIGNCSEKTSIIDTTEVREKFIGLSTAFHCW